MPKLTLAALAATVETLTAELARAHARIDVLRKTAELHHATLANIVTAGLTPEVTARAKPRLATKRSQRELDDWRDALAELREEAGKPTGWFHADAVRARIAARATIAANTAAAA